MTMTRKLSFTKYEHQILPEFRQKINMAESTEDVKKFFVYTAKELFENVFEGKVDFDYEDVRLSPDCHPYCSFSERLSSQEGFASLWKNSDLSHVVGRLAKSATRRYRHLERHPEKTKAKIRV
jgi:hypothetical protein